ncbi:MAG: biotin/lipoyl-binding protein, partial [Anaerolineaceae bacterium]|nr:biotin/lipoyl-binding protein [Anaerolineaceae bacterium]
MQIIRKIFIVILLLGSLSLVGCDVLLEDESPTKNAKDGVLEASGTVEVEDVTVSAEVSGTVAEVFVMQGDAVEVNTELFLLKDEMLDIQRKQALAALEATKAGLEMAVSTLESTKASLEVVEVQYELEWVLVRDEYQTERIEFWDRDQPNEFELPAWYYEKSEEINAA